jgi:hypothetical protein
MSDPHHRPAPVPRPPRPSCPLARPAVLAFVALATGACGERAEIWDRPWDVRGPVPLLEQVAWLDAAREDLVTVGPEGTADGRFSFDVVRQPVGRNPAFLVSSVDRRRALVVTHGTLGGAGLEEEEPRLYDLDPAGEEPPQTYSLRSPFDALALSADGKWALAYFAGAAAVNPNLTAVVRLDRDPGASNPTLRSIRPYGSRPLAVHFLEDLVIGERPRQLALVFSEGYVTLFDIEHLDRRDTTVFLSAREETGAVAPAGMVVAEGDAADPEGAAPYVFLRVPWEPDVYALNLKEDPEREDESENDFQPVVNVIPLPAAPSDFAVFDGAGGKTLLAVSPAGTAGAAAVLDPRTTSTWTVTLDARATAVRVFDGVPADDGDTQQVALLWAAGDASETRAGFLVLDNVEERLHRNLQTVDVGAPVLQVIPTGDPLRVLLVHDSWEGSVSILDVAERTVQRLGVDVVPDLWAMDPGGRSFFFTAEGRSGLFSLALDVGLPQEIRLDAEPSRLFVLPTSGGEALVIDHGWETGYVTVLPLDDPDRDRASSLQGFLAAGALDVDAGRYPAAEEVEQ